MGGVEYHRRSTGITKSSERTHVDDKIAIAEECSTFGYGNVARAAVGVHSAANFLHRAAHSFGLQPLAFLDVDGFARRTGGFEQIGLATEECRDLEHINNTRRGRALFRLVLVGDFAWAAAPMKPANKGWGRVGRDCSSGWNWQPMYHGCVCSSTISTSEPSGDKPLRFKPCSMNCSRYLLFTS